MLFQFKIRRLCQRMHPRVGPRTALDLLPHADHRGNGILQNLCHGQRIVLHLKPVIPGSKVGQREGKVSFCHTISPHSQSEPPITTKATAQIAVKTTRATQGVAVMALKKKAVLQRAVPLAQAGIVNESRYRTRTLPAAGALLREEDSEEKQISLEL